jgi:L-2-hydroxyglutarate oxidase LhgO
MTEIFDFAIVGAGILGLATARALVMQQPKIRAVVLDKERAVAQHQTGHNSGVIHQGIYYKPGSLKAKLCVDGARRMAEYCAEHTLPIARVGKVIVATDAAELPRLEMLYARAVANGVPGISKIERAALHDIEPHAAGLAALYSPNTAIVDYARIAETMRDEIAARGVRVALGARVTQIEPRGDCQIIRAGAEFQARALINCAGLYADKIAQLSGASPDVRILPFRGEYYFLAPDAQSRVRGLIYPVTDPRLPFLGVHFTRTIHGRVEAGPNAVFALAREGYSWKHFRAGETLENLVFPGFARMAQKWWRTGVYEFYRSLSKAAFVRSLQKLVPEICAADLTRGGAGVRAQAVNARGELLDDFCFVETPRALHVLNAPSPAATASLAIGEYIAARAQTLMQ